MASADTLQASLGNDKDPLTTRVSYKLNLKGPSVTVQTASLDLAGGRPPGLPGLLNRECDMALAGGVSIHVPETRATSTRRGAPLAATATAAPSTPRATASSAATAPASWCSSGWPTPSPTATTSTP